MCKNGHFLAFSHFQYGIAYVYSVCGSPLLQYFTCQISTTQCKFNSIIPFFKAALLLQSAVFLILLLCCRLLYQ